MKEELITEACCGGKSVFYDDNAPKEIKSTELTGLSMHFTHSMRGRMGVDSEDPALDFPEGSYHYEIKAKDNGQTVLINERKEYPMDANNLAMLAAVVKHSKAAENNGFHSNTSGLACDVPQFSFLASFASGEQISTSACPGFAGWLFPIATFLDSYMEGFKAYKPQVPQPPKGMAWNCSCGKKGLTSKFCGECGAKSPLNADGSWNCSCGQKSLQGKFCPECGNKSPRE